MRRRPKVTRRKNVRKTYSLVFVKENRVSQSNKSAPRIEGACKKRILVEEVNKGPR